MVPVPVDDFGRRVEAEGHRSEQAARQMHKKPMLEQAWIEWLLSVKRALEYRHKSVREKPGLEDERQQRAYHKDGSIPDHTLPSSTRYHVGYQWERSMVCA